MNYLRYTFHLGFRLILACTFSIVIVCTLALFFSGAWAAALWILLAWIGFVAVCMLSSYIGYRKFKQFNHVPEENESH